jgi:hypothetical protein
MTQSAAGLVLSRLDFERPFSESKALAQFFKGGAGADSRLSSPSRTSELRRTTAVAYLGHRIYYAVSGGVVRGSYLWYDETRATGASEDEIVTENQPVCAGLSRPTYLVVASHWDSERLGERVRRVPAATIEGDERGTEGLPLQKHTDESCRAPR